MTKPQFSADLVTFTEEIRNAKLQFLYGDFPTFCMKATVNLQKKFT